MSLATLVLVGSALVAGLIAGVARKGDLRNVTNIGLRWVGLLAVAAAVLLLVERASPAASTELTLGALALVAVFLARNLHLAGTPVIVLGVALNIGGIALNHGMSVDPTAARAAGLGQMKDSDVQLDSGSRHLRSDEDRVWWLGEVVPVAPLDDVVSFGDLIATAGVGNAAYRLTFRRGRRRKAANPTFETGLASVTAVAPASDDEPVIDLRLVAEASQQGYATTLHRDDRIVPLHPLHVPKRKQWTPVFSDDRSARPDPSTIEE